MPMTRKERLSIGEAFEECNRLAADYQDCVDLLIEAAANW